MKPGKLAKKHSNKSRISPSIGRYSSNFGLWYLISSEVSDWTEVKIGEMAAKRTIDEGISPRHSYLFPISLLHIGFTPLFSYRNQEIRWKS